MSGGHVYLKRHCSSTESIQCKEKKQDGNALSLNFHPVTQSAVNIVKPSEETVAIDLQGDHHWQDSRFKIRLPVTRNRRKNTSNDQGRE
ncbi:protein CyaY [Trichinella spiralis]|uniref:protein CyaY n=1 Tax=Trichinella spiralis TaxID=6334 RepID=UPI0001EFBFA3|nr:protein CyaY [Trichinella spiralis]